MRTRIHLPLLTAIQAVLVGVALAIVASGKLPLGVPGEWEWLRVKLAPPPLALLLAGLGCALYAGFVALGLRALARPSVPALHEAGWVSALLAAAMVIQVVIPTGAADEYDLTKWAYVNYFGSSTGYYQVARAQAMSDPWRFFAAYPVWIQSQDSLHIGTHPPGLIALQCGLLQLMESRPDLARLLDRFMPQPTSAGFRQLEASFRKPIPRTDRAALYASSLITLLACAATVAPLYLLGRATLPPAASWAAAAFWPLVPAANLFQPDADAAYPFLSTLALALASWAARRGGQGILRRLVLACFSGLTLAAGMFFTLAFLPVGLIVALVMTGAYPPRSRDKIALVLAVGFGFLVLTVAGWAIMRANPVPVWIANLKNHARFYVEYPRTYLAWFLVNPVELVIAVGLPVVVWVCVGWCAPRLLPWSFWATFAVVCLLNLSGRNLGEVARLWLLFMPPLMLAAGAGLERVGAGPVMLAASAGLMAAQTLGLQALIQVVYPV